MGNDIALDRLDPETGIQLLSRVPPDDETPEQARLRQFWRHQFEMQLNWRAGDPLAPAKALYACEALGMPPPLWLLKAVLEMTERRLSGAERRQYGDLTDHMRREQALREALGRGMTWEAAQVAASDKLAGTDAAGEPETMQKSYNLVQKAGGEKVTLVSYRRAARRARPR